MNDDSLKKDILLKIQVDQRQTSSIILNIIEKDTLVYLPSRGAQVAFYIEWIKLFEANNFGLIVVVSTNELLKKKLN